VESVQRAEQRGPQVEDHGSVERENSSPKVRVHVTHPRAALPDQERRKAAVGSLAVVRELTSNVKNANCKREE